VEESTYWNIIEYIKICGRKHILEKKTCGRKLLLEKMREREEYVEERNTKGKNGGRNKELRRMGENMVARITVVHRMKISPHATYLQYFLRFSIYINDVTMYIYFMHTIIM